MIDKSGYGKMRDTYKKEGYSSDYDEFDYLREYNHHDSVILYRLLEENIKSKYILADPTKNPIIASKSISVRNTINESYCNNRPPEKSYHDSKLNYTFHENNLYPCRI